MKKKKMIIFSVLVALFSCLSLSSLVLSFGICEYDFCCEDTGGGDCANTKGCDGYAAIQIDCSAMRCEDEHGNETDRTKCHITPE